MVEKRLVTARGRTGAPRRHQDLDVLREALSQMLRRADEDGHLIVQLVIEGTVPALVAADRGVSRSVLVEHLRDAVDELAMEYEDVAYAALGQSAAEQARAALARKRG